MAKRKKKNYLSWICGKIRKRIPVIAFKILLTACVSIAAVLFALVTKGVVNSAILGDQAGLIRFSATLLGLILFQLGGNILLHYLHANLQEDMERDFKQSILHTILRTDYSAICSHHSGDLIQRLDGDAAVIYGAVGTMTTMLVSTVVSLFGAFAALLRLTPVFTIVFCICGALLGAAALLLRRTLKQLSKDSSAATGRVGGFLHESISKLMVVQALDMSREVEKRTDRILDDRWSVRKKQRNMNLLTRTGISTISSGTLL